MKNYKVTKIGLLNFWFYDEEEFNFFGGNLILRGSNGTGKSVTMQSFIPLILDGNKSPERLDPFGMKERHIEDYVIGSREEGNQKEEATSYLYMETYNEEENKYITVGLGFRGRKGKGVDSWGFAIKDGKRIGKDFFLYKDRTNKIPLSKLELRTRLGEIDEFTETTKDYKAMVNRLLFGFPTLTAYDEFIKLLLQLRSNKLSKEFKPTILISVLNNVLEPLTEEELRPLTEAIESMNKTKEYIETLEKNAKSLSDFLKVYKNYNEVVLLAKSREYLSKNNAFKMLKNKGESIHKKLTKNKEELTDVDNRFNEVITGIESNEKVKRELDNKDLKQKVEDLAKLNTEIETLTKKISDINTNIETNEESIIDVNKKKANLDDEIYKLEKELKDVLTETKDLYTDAYFDEIVFFADELTEHIGTEYPFDAITMSLKRHKERVTRVLGLLEEEQSIKLDVEKKHEEYEELADKYKKAEIDLDNASTSLKEAVLTWEEDFVNVLNNNTYLILEDNIKRDIFDLMNNYDNGVFDKVKDIYKRYADNLKTSILKENLHLESKRDKLFSEKNELTFQKEKIENEKDLLIEEDTFIIDKLLSDNNIEYLPLYKVLEYKSGLQDSIKDKLESALLEMRILNAKIIKKEDIGKALKLNEKIIYLEVAPKKKNNLLKYFDINLPEKATISKEYIASILEGISLDEKDTVSLNVNDNNVSLHLDFINVLASPSYKQAFIGYLRRKEIRENKIRELETQISDIQKEIDTLDDTIKENIEKTNIIETEVTLLPTNTHLTDITNKISELNITLSWIDKQEKELESVLKELELKLKGIKEKITESSPNLHIPLNLETYKKALVVISNMQESLSEIRLTHQNYLNKLDMLSNLNTSIERIEETIDYLRIDLGDAEKRLKVSETNKQTIEDILKTDVYREQKERLMKVEEELKHLAEEKEELISKRATLNLEIERDTIECSELETTIQKEEEILSLYREAFIREYELKYVYKEDLIDILKTCETIVKEGNSKKDIQLNVALSKFYEAYNHYSLELNEYSLRTTQLFNDYDVTKYENSDIKNYLSSIIRTDVEAHYQGVKVNLIELASRLEDDILINKDLISKQDRHLFEDVLINTVGEKIRDKIDASKEWINKINNIMANMQENSALSFKLVWESASAKEEGEIDTKEIVRLLKMDPKMLKDSDVDKLTNHFRRKINKAEDLYKDSYISFSKIVEGILDYRTWFTFKLLYQRTGLEKKELTDKIFSRFSGGERAKSMYIPLIAGTYVKLNLAKSNSLRLVALDEAFAGVDDDNIREMFGILKNLDLNYVMTSQSLWGDYDTVEDTSICEIIRPHNSQVITLERYRWNGKYKSIVTKSDIEEELNV